MNCCGLVWFVLLMVFICCVVSRVVDCVVFGMWCWVGSWFGGVGFGVACEGVAFDALVAVCWVL